MIKKSLLTLIVALFCVNIGWAQRGMSGNSDCPKFYLGLSTGLENPAGLLGVNLELPIQDFSVGAGLGYSLWGAKVYCEGRYYFSPCNRGWAVGLGVSHSSGFQNLTINQETNVGKADVVFDLKPQTNVFFSGYHFFRLGQRHRFYLQGGYSARLTNDIYSIKSPNFYLTSNGDAAMRVLAPGGLILALGFSFGI